jgi:hypothetical protein
LNFSGMELNTSFVFKALSISFFFLFIFKVFLSKKYGYRLY